MATWLEKSSGAVAGPLERAAVERSCGGALASQTVAARLDLPVRQRSARASAICSRDGVLPVRRR
jgi:hypothetical protein